MIDDYANFEAHAGTNPYFGINDMVVCNTATYNTLIGVGESLVQANDVMQSLAMQSGLRIPGAQ